MTARIKYTRDLLAEVVAQSSNWCDLMRRLNRAVSGGLRKQLQKLVAQFGIDTSHFSDARRRSSLSVDPEELAVLVRCSTSFAEVMRRLGLTTDSGNHRKIRLAIHRAGIDTSHFTRRSTDLPPGRLKRPAAAVVLVVRPSGSARSSHPGLRRAMTAGGIPYRCARCGNPGEWMGQCMTLPIDHISGDRLDNRLENLRFLCPNCHSLPDTCRSGDRRGRDDPSGDDRGRNDKTRSNPSR